MSQLKFFVKQLFFLSTFIFLFSFAAFAQATGGVKGTVKNTAGDKVAGVLIEAKQEGKDVTSVKTDGKGDFVISNLTPGVYSFVFNKDGLSEGVLTNVNVKGGQIITLKRLIMGVDKGRLANVRGSVFDPNGRIVIGAKIEVYRVTGDNLKKLGERYSDGAGEFAYRLPAEAARYRFTVSIQGAETTSKDLEVNGAEVYRFAITLAAVNGER